MRLQEMLEWSAELAGCDAVPADSQVYVEAERDLHRVLFGIDIGIGEILVARDAGFDAVVAHHPIGDRAAYDFERVVRRQVEQMTAEGIDRERAETVIDERIAPLRRGRHMANVNQVVDTARLIGMPLANIHLACDLVGRQVIVDLLASRGGAPATVGDAIARIQEIPEIEAGATRPEAWVGSPHNRLGRYTVAMAGGTNGGHAVFREYYAAGVDTIFAMHVAEGDLQRLLEDEVSAGKSLVVTGHMSTDSVGVNRVIAGLEERGIAVTRTSGIIAP